MNKHLTRRILEDRIFKISLDVSYLDFFLVVGKVFLDKIIYDIRNLRRIENES